jgi:hypothetical protein
MRRFDELIGVGRRTSAWQVRGAHLIRVLDRIVAQSSQEISLLNNPRGENHRKINVVMHPRPARGGLVLRKMGTASRSKAFFLFRTKLSRTLLTYSGALPH